MTARAEDGRLQTARTEDGRLRTGLLELLKVVHEKTLATSGRHMSLGLYEAEDGSHVYGVVEDGALVFAGTKVEAKERYGHWRRLG